ncbi:MAG: hypothetical protein ABI462_00385 [Ignavibacteria bacterium]
MISIAMLVSTSFSVIALRIVRRKLNWETFRENHEVGGFLFNALGLIYAVLIAFVVYATWADYNSARDFCDREANMLQDLYLNTEALPESIRSPIKEKILQYLSQVINEDWPLLSVDESNPSSKQTLIALWKIYMSMENFENEKQKVVFEESIIRLNNVTDYRRMRVLSSQNHIPVVIWTVIVIGALTSVGFSLFFGTRSLAVQATMTSLFATTNSIILILILALDHPFTGDIKITSFPFESVLSFLKGNLG